MLVCTLYKDLPLDVLFRGWDNEEAFDFDVSPRLERFMTFTRFQHIGRCLTFARPPASADERADRGDF